MIEIRCKKCHSQLENGCKHEWNYIETTQIKPKLIERRNKHGKTVKRS